MLETEEVDDDYFTPVSSASLANIFGKSSVIDDKSENESLKYTPPKPHNVNKHPEDSKATSCVFACVLVAYEWHNNIYIQKGKLGFALIKVVRTGTHNMILYDSNKSTLSNLSVSSKSKINLKSNNYMSYYDDQRKYWSLYGAQNDIKTITDLLKSLDVTIDTSTETDINPPEPVTEKEVQSPQENSQKPIESDTDASIHRKTKDSILNRMANMGHSVLPPSTVSVDKTSDSSDTNNEVDYHIKTVRHKPVKGIIKKNNLDKTLDLHKIVDVETPGIRHNITDIKNMSSFTNDQLVPLVNTIVNSPSGNDMNVFITEQRISNTELRINMGRMSDKLEHLVSKINLLELKTPNEGTAEINTQILHKLLGEYETKIKNYEELLKKMGTQSMTTGFHDQSVLNDEALKSKIKELENTVKEKEEVISMLQNEIKVLMNAKDTQINALKSTICELEAEINSKQDLVKDLTETNKELNETSSSSNVENKIKTLMNDTYQAVATNFEDEETYSGESTKKIIAMVIKKVTISALNDSISTH